MKEDNKGKIDLSMTEGSREEMFLFYNKMC